MTTMTSVTMTSSMTSPPTSSLLLLNLIIMRHRIVQYLCRRALLSTIIVIRSFIIQFETIIDDTDNCCDFLLSFFAIYRV